MIENCPHAPKCSMPGVMSNEPYPPCHLDAIVQEAEEAIVCSAHGPQPVACLACCRDARIDGEEAAMARIVAIIEGTNAQQHAGEFKRAVLAAIGGIDRVG